MIHILEISKGTDPDDGCIEYLFTVNPKDAGKAFHILKRAKIDFFEVIPCIFAVHNGDLVNTLFLNAEYREKYINLIKYPLLHLPIPEENKLKDLK